jgi:hypothetical protein
VAVFIIGCGGGGDGSSSGGSNGGNNDGNVLNVALGPISGANVYIYDTDGNKIYSTTTNTFDSNNDEINGSLVSFSKQKVGKFKIDKNKISKYKNKILKIVISGGKDIDADDNGIVDNNFTDVKGNLYAFVYGNDLLEKK